MYKQAIDSILPAAERQALAQRVERVVRAAPSPRHRRDADAAAGDDECDQGTTERWAQWTRWAHASVIGQASPNLTA